MANTEPSIPERTAFDWRVLLAPRATAIAGFTFAVLSMLGQGGWTVAAQALVWGPNFESSSLYGVLTAGGVAGLVIAAIGGLLALHTLRTNIGPSWEQHLAGAAVLVASVSVILAVLTIIGGLLNG